MQALIIEDSPSSALIVTELLKKMDIHSSIASDGEAGIALFKQHSFDLILLDVVMPGIDGYETARQIRGLENGQSWTPIIFLTAQTNDEQLLLGIEAGGDDYLLKPVSAIVLQAKIMALRRIAQMRYTLLHLTRQLEETRKHLEEDIRSRELAERKLHARNNELIDLNARLSTLRGKLLQSERLASIGQLAAGIAHEINNPISFILSNFTTQEKHLNALLAWLGPDSALELDARQLASLRADEEFKLIRSEMAEIIEENKTGLQRVKKIVQSLRDFSQIDHAQAWGLYALSDCAELALNTLGENRFQQIEIQRDYQCHEALWCCGAQINQVFANLICNALEAMPTGGCLRISVGQNPDSHEAWFEVADSGVGIPPELHQRVFDPFYTTKPIGSGTGMGLAQVYGIIQSHQGRIALNSTPGKGSCFRVELPLRQDSRNLPAQPEAPQPPPALPPAG